MAKEDRQQIMFEAAVSKFAESVGAESNLIPVPDLDSSFHLEPLKVVIKKNPKWFWQSTKYEPATLNGIFLHELLVDTSPFSNLKQETHTLLTYNKSHKFSVEGKIGAKLKSVLEVEAKGSDFVEVQAKFGEVLKKEVDEYELMEALKSRKLDMKNDFLKQVRQNKRKVLCVVVGTATLKDEGTLTTNTKVSGEEGIGESKTIEKVAEADESISVSTESTKSFTLEAGTALAVNVCELMVQQDGSLELMIAGDCKGGFQGANSGGSLLSCGRG